jgi:hypothetical protein
MPAAQHPEARPGRTGRDGDRTAAWLDLLGELTTRHSAWLLLKHPESGFVGTGDIDSAGPRAIWGDVANSFRNWARRQELGAVIECPHAPGWLHLVALDPEGGHFWELDVNERKRFLGSTFYTPQSLRSLTVVDERGFRRLRPGAEGLIKLLHNGIRRGGRENRGAIRAKGIAELLAADPEGVVLAARLVGVARRPALRGARACAAGGWDRPAMLAVEARFAVRALVEPAGLAWRVRSSRVRRDDPVLAAVFSGDRHPLGREEDWLETVRRDHRVDD